MSDGIEQLQMHARAVPEIGWDKMMQQAIQTIDNFIDGIIHRAGDLMGAGMMAAAGKAVDGAAAITNTTLSVGAAPFKDGFIASTSPGLEVSADRTPGIKIAMDSPNLSQLGDLSPDATPSMGRSQGASVGRT